MFKEKIIFIFFKIIKKIILKNKNQFKDSRRFAVYNNDLISIDIILNGLYEKHIIYFLKEQVFNKKIISNEICIDVGANIGNHTYIFSKFFDKVLSFEPNNNLFKLLNFNTESLSNVTTFNLAVSNNNQNKLFFENQRNLGASKIIENKSEKYDNEKNIKNVKSVYLDHFIDPSDYNKIRYIKIDAEDHDFYVLKGAKNIITSSKPLISIELKSYLYKRDLNNFESIIFLKELGYKYFYNINKYKYQYFFSQNYLLKILIFLLFYKNNSHYNISLIESFERKNYEFLIASHKSLN